MVQLAREADSAGTGRSLSERSHRKEDWRWPEPAQPDGTP